jgi:8-amino-7-oxononanoate synthase
MSFKCEWIDRDLDTLKRAGWYRSPRNLDGMAGRTIWQDGKELLNFASNDYLGLAGDRRLRDVAIRAIETYGTGSTGSRLTSGERPIHRELEAAIAKLKGVEDALVFSSGYSANIGVIPAIVGARDAIFGDAYNHASLKNGMKLSGAAIYEYHHGDLTELVSLLERHRREYRRSAIVTDTVFSMDGDIGNLPEIVTLAERYDCTIVLDEAHATGIFGDRGAGVIEYFQLPQFPCIELGTLSKALGSLGGFVAGSYKLIDYLRNRCASWIYTTGLSPPDAAAAAAAIEIINTEPERRQKLWDNTHHFHQSVADLAAKSSQIKLIPTNSQILCLQLPNPTIAVEFSHLLADRGIFVPAIRPPTVPTSRLRFSLTAAHDRADIDFCLDALASLAENLVLT